MQRSKSVGAKTEVNETALKIRSMERLEHAKLFEELYEDIGLKRSWYKTNAAYIADIIEKQLTDIRNEVESWLPKDDETWFQYKCRFMKLKKEKFDKLKEDNDGEFSYKEYYKSPYGPLSVISSDIDGAFVWSL